MGDGIDPRALPRGVPVEQVLERLKAKMAVSRVQVGPCLVYRGRGKKGNRDEKIFAAELQRKFAIHDVAWLLYTGSLPPEGQRAAPTCGLSQCVKHEHLELTNRYGRPKLPEAVKRARKTARQRRWRHKKRRAEVLGE